VAAGGVSLLANREKIGAGTDSVENPARLKIMRGLAGLV
jgi:hypothetical protein